MIKNIIFDWSGVIKDSAHSHIWAVNEMLKELGGEQMTKEDIQDQWEQPYMNFWNKRFPDLKIEDQSDLYHRTIAREDCPVSESYPGIVDLIKKLKEKGCSMAVLSSDAPKILLPEMTNYGLDNIFCELITDIHNKAEGIDGLMKRNNFKKEETIFIGDSNHEVEVGKQFGIKTIAVTWGFSSEKKLKTTEPDYLVHNIKELEQVLLHD